MASRNEVHEAKDVLSALRNACEAIDKTGKSAVIKVWVDPNDDAPGTKEPATVQMMQGTALARAARLASASGALREISDGNT
jgi:hypothetical protein